MKDVKVIHQTYTVALGLRESWGVMVGDYHNVFYSKEELEAFLRGLNGS